MLTESEFSKEEHAILEKIEKESYTGRIDIKTAPSNLWADVVGEDLVIDPYYEAGIQSMFINDYRIDPFNNKTTSRKGESSINTSCMIVTYKGWPYMFVKAKGDVDELKELIMDYSPAYWNGLKMQEKQMGASVPSLKKLRTVLEQM